MRLRFLFALCVAAGVTAPAALMALQLATYDVGAPYMLLLLSVLAAAIGGGGIAGGLATVFSLIITWFFFIPPVWSFALPRWEDGVTIGVFVLVAAICCRVYQRQKRVIDELADTNLALRTHLSKLGRADLAI